MRLFALLFILALMFGCARPAAAAPSSDPGTRAVQDWLSYRYLYPRRWDLATMLQALHRRGLLQTKAGQKRGGRAGAVCPRSSRQRQADHLCVVDGRICAMG